MGEHARMAPGHGLLGGANGAVFVAVGVLHEDRADKIGAKFTVWSVPGEGTRIEVVVPESAITAGGAAPVSAGPSPIRDA